jgi:hypothetical protein
VLTTPVCLRVRMMEVYQREMLYNSPGVFVRQCADVPSHYFTSTVSISVRHCMQLTPVIHSLLHTSVTISCSLKTNALGGFSCTGNECLTSRTAV